MWRVVLTCTQPKCHNKHLTACGLYKTVRWVLDITGYFHIGTEYLECGAFHKKYAAWSFEMLKPAGHRACLAVSGLADLQVLD